MTKNGISPIIDLTGLELRVIICWQLTKDERDLEKANIPDEHSFYLHIFVAAGKRRRGFCGDILHAVVRKKYRIGWGACCNELLREVGGKESTKHIIIYLYMIFLRKGLRRYTTI